MHSARMIAIKRALWLQRPIVPSNDCSQRRRRAAALGHELSVEMPDATTASDWLPTFEFGLANDSSCLSGR